jgi:hypothetical protein
MAVGAPERHAVVRELLFELCFIGIICSLIARPAGIALDRRPRTR